MSIFIWIEELSNKLGKWLYKKDKDVDKELEYWEYQSFKILSQLFTFLAGFFLSILFGYTIQMIIVSFTFAFLRSMIGGYHCNSFRNCFYLSNVIFLVGGIFSVILKDYYIYLFIISCFGGIFITPYIPKKANEDMPDRGEERKYKLRKSYRNRFLICFILNILLIFLINQGIDVRTISTSISCSIILVSIVMSNTFDFIMSKIEK